MEVLNIPTILYSMRALFNLLYDLIRKTSRKRKTENYEN